MRHMAEMRSQQGYRNLGIETSANKTKEMKKNPDTRRKTREESRKKVKQICYTTLTPPKFFPRLPSITRKGIHPAIR